jgi:hypothetical protein
MNRGEIVLTGPQADTRQCGILAETIEAGYAAEIGAFVDANHCSDVELCTVVNGNCEE